MKRVADRPNSNFRQQDSTARKLENNFDTAAQKQFAQTATVIEIAGDQEKKQAKLQKQQTKQTDHSSHEFRQQESTVNKIERTLDTEEQQQLTRSASVMIDNSPENNGGFQGSNSNKSKLQKQFSNQAREEFKQEEIKSEENHNQSQLRNQLEQDYQTQETTAAAHKNKLRKKFSDQANEGFKQQESTANKIDRVLQTEEQRQLAQSANAIAQKANSETDALQKSKNSVKQKKYRLRKELAKGSLSTVNNGLKNGIQKYQSELEKDDEAVKLTSQSATYTAKLSSKVARKLKEKRLENANFKKAKENPLYKEKPKEKPKETSLNKITKMPGVVFKKSVVKYQNELEKDDEAVKLASQSATQISRATKKLTKGAVKIKNGNQSGKLGKQDAKIIPFDKKKKLKTESKTALKKKAVKKKMYYDPKKKKKAVVEVLSSFSNRMSDVFKNIAKVNRIIVTKVLGAKAAALLGGGLAAVLPLIIVAALVLVMIGVLGGTSEKSQPFIGSKNLSPEVERWRSLVETEAAAQGMESYVNLLLAIMQVESGGTGTRDIMQSSESAGFPRNYWSTEEQSVRQAVKHLKSIVNMVKPFGLETNYKLLAQAYNFGSAFAKYVTKLGGSYDLGVAERYSRDVVAPSLGNHTGETYPYKNETSIRLGKPYLYRNGGNFMYGELVSEYLGGGAGVTGDFAIVVAELEKYIGQPYVWGGKSPKQGFDCSGLVYWGLKQIGINFPSPAASQYTKTVPINPSEAQPGDLIFFRGTYGGPNHVSHVGFYIDETTMLDSNSSGVGYHNWKSTYWQKHRPEIRRIAK